MNIHFGNELYQEGVTMSSDAFYTRLNETEEQIRRLEQIFQNLGMRPEVMESRAMKAMIEEANAMIEQPAVP